MKTNISKLWKTEDWLAVWIGFIVIAIACLAVLTGAFDFAAAKFSTWHLWENVGEKKSLLDQLNGAFWVKLLRTFLVLGILFTLGVKNSGTSLALGLHLFLHSVLDLARRQNVLELNADDLYSPRVGCLVEDDPDFVVDGIA